MFFYFMFQNAVCCVSGMKYSELPTTEFSFENCHATGKVVRKEHSGGFFGDAWNGVENAKVTPYLCKGGKCWPNEKQNKMRVSDTVHKDWDYPIAPHQKRRDSIINIPAQSESK